MSYHIVSIDTPECRLSCRDGQLTCRTGNGPERKLPLEDVASIIVTSFSATVHSQLLIEAAQHGVTLIFCEDFKPVSLVLPANRSTDTLLTRAQLDLTDKERTGLWQKTIDAKCRNQASLAEWLLPKPNPVSTAGLHNLRRTAEGKNPHKESTCARLYWRLWGACVLQSKDREETFMRERSAPGPNALLNYGYAVLLSTVLHKLLGVGLDPTFGINHVPRERSTPLAYDLMEPFRPCVDARVAEWLKNRPGAAEEGVTKEFRQWVTGFPLEKVDHLGFTLDVRSCVEAVIRSFRKALMSRQRGLYKPWTLTSSRWAGYSSPSTSPS
jgi:CRISPR-associated protein Cas1